MQMTNSQQVERWGLFETALQGPKSGNPFMEVQLSARFECGDHVLEPDGFYDGDGIYRIRLMPDRVGRWRFTTRSNVPAAGEASAP